MSYQVACQIDDLAAGEGLAVELTDPAGTPREIAIIRDENGGWHAIDAICTHGDVPLAEGDVEGNCVECWGHGAQFDLTTGEPTLPATEPVRVYPVQLAGSDVLVEITE